MEFGLRQMDLLEKEEAGCWADLRLGDCLEVLKTMPENSVDSIVTDPPAGIAFMGKNWDKNKGGRDNWIAWMQEIAAECLRIVKPGGHALVWAIPRTSHWTATAWENAGFEVRDSIVHAFGSGFPKSLNIGKNVDRLLKNERKLVGKNFNYRPVSGKKGYLGESNFRQTDGMSLLTKGTSEHEGFGTALKPAIENWLLLRKPLSEKTIAENVLRWKCGGINVDGCRIKHNEKNTCASRYKSGLCHSQQSGNAGIGYAKVNYGKYAEENAKRADQGRFPANLILSYPEDEYDESGNPLPNPGKDEILGLFPMTKSGKPCGIRKAAHHWKSIEHGTELSGFGDTGSAARFFYCAKASKAERDAGLRDAGSYNFRENGSLDGKKTEPRKNNHPTVKPIKLMRYLCRLITFPGGTVLDPFMGSGTTGKAARQEGFNFIGIEKEPEYFQIAEKRIFSGGGVKTKKVF